MAEDISTIQLKYPHIASILKAKLDAVRQTKEEVARESQATRHYWNICVKQTRKRIKLIRTDS